jgi:uncharacterized membrane protein
VSALIDVALPVAVLLGVVGSGLLAGLFFAFSTSVMPGLRRLPPDAGAAAMQVANRAILNPVFLAVFLGTTVVCVLVAVAAPFSGRGGAVWLVIGALLEVVGAFVLTMVVNVPLNNRLDAVDPTSAEGGRVWTEYLARWTAWNHVRAVASAGATAALTLGMWI